MKRQALSLTYKCILHPLTVTRLCLLTHRSSRCLPLHYVVMVSNRQNHTNTQYTIAESDLLRTPRTITLKLRQGLLGEVPPRYQQKLYYRLLYVSSHTVPVIGPPPPPLPSLVTELPLRLGWCTIVVVPSLSLCLKGTYFWLPPTQRPQ